MSEPATKPAIATIGFIGLGVMGEPMCGHLARRSGVPVVACDLRPEPLDRLAAHGVKPASMRQIAAGCEVILLSLPDGKAVAGGAT
jgi:3-hydroxyisobutyrate dehydrogenase